MLYQFFLEVPHEWARNDLTEPALAKDPPYSIWVRMQCTKLPGTSLDNKVDPSRPFAVCNIAGFVGSRYNFTAEYDSVNSTCELLI